MEVFKRSAKQATVVGWGFVLMQGHFPNGLRISPKTRDDGPDDGFGQKANGLRLHFMTLYYQTFLRVYQRTSGHNPHVYREQINIKSKSQFLG